MADETTQTTESTPPAEHKVRNVNAEYVNRSPATEQQPSLKLPEKFKTVDDLVKAYAEAESKITEYGTKYKNYDDYAKIGPPDQIEQALNWAREVKAAMDSGKLRHVAEAEATRKIENQQQNTAPWDAQDWEFKPESERARAMFEYQQAQTKSYIDSLAAQYGKQIEGYRQTDGREKALMLKTIKAAINNPGADPEQLLERMAQYATKSPEELLQMVLDGQSNTPESRQKEIDRIVETRLAEKRQDWEKERFNDFTTSRKPKFSSKSTDRATEDRDILSKLAKEGFRW